MTLQELLNKCIEEKRAIAHFNFSDSTQFNAIAEASAELKMPVIAGLSKGEKNFIKLHNALALRDAARAFYGAEIFLNLDHAHSADECKSAVLAGFDSVMFDGSSLSIEENIVKSAKLVRFVREFEKKEGKNVVVEAEIGYIGSSSKILDIESDKLDFEKSDPKLALDFVLKSKVDALAPSVGNLHGMFKNAPNPDLDIKLISQIRELLPRTTLVLHGGSGIKNGEFKKAIEAGINVVHINSEIRKVYRESIEKSLRDNPDEIAPYKYLQSGKDAVKEHVIARMELFYKNKESV